MDRRIAVALPLAALLHAPGLMAVGPLPPFSFVDEDGDRKISRSEASAERDLIRVFDQLDSNRDGRLSRLEYLDASKPRGRSASPVALDRGVATDSLLTGNVLP